MKKNILIIGNNLGAESFAKIFYKDFNVFITSGNKKLSDIATCVDIRSNNIVELLDFALENDISMVIPTSKDILESNIAKVFAENNIPILAPKAETAALLFNKTNSKKLMYKLKIPTPRFGIFEKLNLMLDYLKRSEYPVVIKTNEKSSATILPSYSVAKSFLESFFNNTTQKVLIEDYVNGTPFAFYVLTDGYKALPLGSSLLYKHSLNGNGGQLTTGMGACVPNYKLSDKNIHFIMERVIYPVLEHLQIIGEPYLGILGVNGILSDDNLSIIDFTPTMSDCDSTSILQSIDDNLYKLFESCILGTFSDDVDFIKTKDYFYATLSLHCNNKMNSDNIINGLEEIEEDTMLEFYPNINKNRYLEYIAENGAVVNLITQGRTVTSAVKKAYESAQNIDFKGLLYRTDICSYKQKT